MTRAAVTGWGAALPERVVTNAEIADSLGVDEEWIRARTGISARRVAAPADTSSSLATRAAIAALDAAGVDAADLDHVIVATSTPDHQLPATAPLVQAAIGARRAGAFDVGAACAGFLYALAQANALVCSGMARNVLVCGADVMSRVTDRAAAGTAILFGDGAGAAVVTATDDDDFLGPFVLRSDGSGAPLLNIPPGEEMMLMHGREVYRHAVEAMTSALREILVVGDVRVDELRLVVAHQANARILEAVAGRLGIERARMVMDIARVGNTSAASIPLALVEAHAQGLVVEGDRIALTAFGAGFVWGAGLMTWRAPVVAQTRPVEAVLTDA
ncbi:MAG: beta-ketoacyl-ACP synthase 3 [Actinomycetota bacterium]|nr:beta-ketoacyl-ACP synthase 3 [Actinomycetota bacterium]